MKGVGVRNKGKAHVEDPLPWYRGWGGGNLGVVLTKIELTELPRPLLTSLAQFPFRYQIVVHVTRSLGADLDAVEYGVAL